MLGLAEHHAFARALVNSGHLSVPSFLVDSRLNTADDAVFAGNMVPGAPMDDAPIATADGESWLLQALGDRFQVLHYVADAADLDAASVAALQSLAEGAIPVEPIVVAARGQAPAGLRTLTDAKGRIRERYDLQPGTTYLVRPDQHVTARWRALDPARVRAAVARATCNA